MKILLWIVIIAAVAFWIGRLVQRGRSAPQPPAIQHDKQAAQRITRLPSKIRTDLDALLRRGDRINAIKLIEDSTDFDARASKDIIDERARQLGL